jgi:RND family efflux transporter MFP subunit
MENIKMKLRHTLIAGLAAMMVLGCSHEEAKQAPRDTQAVQADLVAVQAVNSARAIEVQGFVQPEKETFLSSRAMGPIVKVHTRAGEQVKKGDLLLEIQQDLSHGQLAQAQGAKAQAEAALNMAERNFQRFQKLYNKNSCSELELDMARMQFEQAKGAVKQASGAVAAAGSVANESEVRAPFDALVVEKMVNLGDLCAPGRPLVRLQSNTGRRLWLTVRESDARFVHIGQELPVTIDSRRDLGTIAGRVAEIVPAADMATHTFMVKVDLDVDHLMSGLTGHSILPGDKRESLLVPEEAVFQSGGLSLVVMVDSENKARTRAVTLGMVTDGMVEVLSGVKASDRVVATLKAPIADGTPIQAN